MTSSRRNHSPFTGRRSPHSSSAYGKIQESDFEYVEPDRRTTPLRPEDLRYTSDHPRHAMDDESVPDVIIIRHLNTNYPLRFKAYAISDGLVTVGDIRYFAAQELGVKDPRRLKLLYKDRHLKRDEKTAKSEGLKQHSEVVVVVSEAPLHSSESASSSEVEEGHSTATRDPGRKKKRRSKKSKPLQPARDSTSPSGVGSNASVSSPPSGSPPVPNSPRDKVEKLATKYSTEWKPLCQHFLMNPPPDDKSRDFEYKKLTESVLQHIIMKADDIEMEGDTVARQERKALLNEAQEMLKKLDVAVGKRS